MNKAHVLRAFPCLPPAISDFGMTRFGIDLKAKAQILDVDGWMVLEIDLFRIQPDGEDGSVLVVRYFAEKHTDTFRAWIMPYHGGPCGEWKRVSIDNAARIAQGGLASQNGNYWYRERPLWSYADDDDKRTVAYYLAGTGSTEISGWENRIQSDRYYSAMERRQMKINNMMDELIPPWPDGFEDWMHREVFGRDYAFVKKPEKEGGFYSFTCTACGGTWKRKKNAGLGYTVCPKCGKEVLVSHKKEEVSKEEQIFLLQPCTDGRQWVERGFRVKARWDPGKGRVIGTDEQIRIITQRGRCWGECFYEVGIRADGKRKYWEKNTFSRRMKKGYLYPGTKAEVEKLWCDELKHSGLWDIAGRTKVNVNHVIINAPYRPCMEYLLKGRFYTMAAQLINNGDGWENINKQGSSPGELFRLSNDRVDRLRRMDGGLVTLRWLQEEQEKGKKISQENLEYVTKHGLTPYDMWDLLDRTKSPEAAVNYIRRQAEGHKKSCRDVMGIYRDYIRMAQEQGLNIDHEIFYKPKDLYKAHDDCVRAGHAAEARKRAEKIRGKFPQVEDVLARIRAKYAYDGEDFSIVVPEGITDIIHEGRALGHCIDTTDRYFDRIQQETSYLVFLRHSAQKNVPWYTLEIEPGGTVRQQRTTGNDQKKEDAKEYMPFIREWQAVVKKRISEEDRRLAEQSREIRIQEYAELRRKKEKVWRGKLAGKQLADVLEADLIECV